MTENSNARRAENSLADPLSWAGVRVAIQSMKRLSPYPHAWDECVDSPAFCDEYSNKLRRPWFTALRFEHGHIVDKYQLAAGAERFEIL